MMKSGQNKSAVYNILVVISCIVFVITPKSTNAQEVDDESEFDYGENSAKGPTNWGSIKAEWSACSSGTMQSPVDLGNWTKEVTSFESWPRSYQFANATLKNRGHDIQIEWEDDAGRVVIAGSEYFLRSAHWHTPSEHTINGTRYDMELQLVHTNNVSEDERRISIIAILFKIGEPDEKFLTDFMANISSIVDKKNSEIALDMVNPYELVQLNQTVNFMYTGSLTVPPCTEGVVWIVCAEIESVSKEQVDLFLRAAVDDVAEGNARPLQPTNNREITLFYPHDLFEDSD